MAPRSSSGPSASASSSSASRSPGPTTRPPMPASTSSSALIDTAGADEVARMVQRRDHPDHTWFIGKGKATELHELCLAVDADTVVFDNELSPAQQYNLEKLLGRTAIDRTAVILDIFAQNAHTLEGKAQVELALLRYRLPRLRRGANARLSQQRGGVGMRFGGGETKLEVDRRRIMRRISRLETELDRARPNAPAATPAARPQRARRRDHRRLHQRRQVDAAQHADRCRRADRGPPVRHARPDHPPPGAPWRGAGAVDGHGRVRAAPAARTRRVVQEHARGGQPRRLPRCTSSTPPPPIPTGRSPPSARSSARSARPPCPSCWSSTRPTSRPPRPSRSSPTIPMRWPSARRRARASTPSCARSATGCGRSPTSSSWSCPTTAATCWRRSTARARSCRPPTSRSTWWCGRGCRRRRPGGSPSSWSGAAG